MAFRSAMIMRSLTTRSKTLSAPKTTTFVSPKPSSPIPPSAFSSSTRPTPSAASRLAVVLGSVESMMPLHSAVASARLRSSLATDSTCWSWLSQGFATPL